MKSKSQLLIYTFHKCASMFIYRLGAELSRQCGLVHHSTNYAEQREAIFGESWARYIEARPGPACFAPIRIGSAAPHFPTDLAPYVVIGHVRDPRDVLTSAFYSYAYRHEGVDPVLVEKWRAAGVDAFVLEQAAEVLGTYQELLAAQARCPELRMVKYETLVTDFPTWLNQVFAALEPFAPPPKMALGLIKREVDLVRVRQHLESTLAGEFKVSGEDIARHKRQVTPGDHKRKLAAGTIEALNTQFGAVLRELDYPL